jgi:uncharacterized membrane protein HdeD (DUF308 family)
MTSSAIVVERIEGANVVGLAQRWWTLALRGAAAMLFGILTFFAPALSLYTLVLLFGAYVLVDGVFCLALAFRGQRSGRRWGSLILEGVASLAIAVVTLFWPGITAVTLVLLIAAWAVVTGTAQLAAAIRLRRQIEHEWVLGLGGALSIAFGTLLFLAPQVGALAMVLWIGAYAVVFGGLLVAFSFRLRSWARRLSPPLAPHGMRA